VELKLNGTHQLLVYDDDVNLQGHKIDTIKKNTEILIDASKEVGLEVNAKKPKYMLLSRHWTAVQTHESSQTFRKYGTVQIIWNDNNKSKLDSGENWKLRGD
jgi:hypothetical protein